MKRSEFPEKAYEAFINHELLSKGYMIYMPSQRKEKSVGYDALLHASSSRRFKAKIMLDILKRLKHWNNDKYKDQIKIEIVIGEARYEIR